MKANEINLLLRNNTGNKAKDSLIDGFVIRTRIFNNIFSELSMYRSDKPEQNYLVIGQRGAGKTTLLYRLKYAIDDDPKLSDIIIPVMFSEEQYNLLDLINLWESIAEYLEEYPGFEYLSDEILRFDTNSSFREELVYDLLESNLKRMNKKLVVFIENIDVFFKKIGREGQKRLREVLTTSSNIRLICSSTTYFDAIIDYSEPFYQFFKIIQLDGLTKGESVKLLNKLAEQRNEIDQIQQIVSQHPKRLESLRRLTGGNPRIISYLFQIFLDNENGKAIVDLYKLLDDITYLYKAELDQLSAQQQKIVDSIARAWDAVSTKEIVSRTGIDSKHVSSILNTLEKNQIVESISTKTKNNLYRLKDRFLNIWYLMRFGRKREKENVIWLVRFYDAWCDKTELSKRITSHIRDLKGGKYDFNAALDMGNVFLSCENVPSSIKFNLYQTTKSYLPKELVKELRLSDTLLYNSIKDFVKRKEFEKAINTLSELSSQKKYHEVAGWVYLKQGNFKSAIDHLISLYGIKPSGELAISIARIYETELDDSKNAFKYFEFALEQSIWESAYRLGQISFYDFDDIVAAEKYHRVAIENGYEESIMALATIFFSIGDLESSEILVRMAINNGDIAAENNLAVIYRRKGQLALAIKTYEEAIERGNTFAILNLGRLYMGMEEPNFEKARTLFEKAIAAGEENGYYELGRLFREQGDEDSGERLLLQGVEARDPDSAHLLGHIYLKQGKWSKAEQYFVKSIRWGRYSSLICLAEGAFVSKRNKRKAYVLQQFEEHLDEIPRVPLFMIEYARLLLWNDRFESALEILSEIQDSVVKILTDKVDEEYKEIVVGELTQFFTFLLSRGQYKAAYAIFQNPELQFRQILKPVYFALMSFMKDEYPSEFLKAGDELKETVEEVVREVENYRIDYI